MSQLVSKLPLFDEGFYEVGFTWLDRPGAATPP
jgi:hypothetical protein